MLWVSRAIARLICVTVLMQLADLGLWYSFGPGNPASAAQGVGYVQELVARLTQTPIDDFSTVLNRTLDGNNVTFPLHQPVYVDATHDTVITTSAPCHEIYMCFMKLMFGP